MNRKLLFVALGIVVLVLVGGALYNNIYKQVNNQNKANQDGKYGTSNDSDSSQNTCSTDYGIIDAPRSTANGAFTSAVTTASSIRVISPGKLVGDARFTYLWIKNRQSIPVFAPADGVLVQIFYKTRADLSSDLSKPDYDLVFFVDCHTMYRINHITDPIDEITSQKPISEPLELKPGSGFDDRDARPKNNIYVKAGQQIGTTTGTPSAHNFDFGIFVDKQAVCPYDQFVQPIRSEFLSLLGNTSSPISGTNCDVSGMY